MSTAPQHTPPIAIIGAGVSGMLAAHDLQAAGHDVVLLDKGHRSGGRLATRRVGSATFDHGAQFLTARDHRFSAIIAALRADGIVVPWFHGLPDLTPRNAAVAANDHEERLRGAPTMRALAEELARGLDVRLAARVTHITSVGSGWSIRSVDDDGRTAELIARAAIVTCPTPQTLALLDASGVDLSEPIRTELSSIAYDPCIAVLAVPDGPTELPNAGALRLDDPQLTWLTDNLRSGASSEPAVTIHANPSASRALWDCSDIEVGAQLTAAAERYLGVSSTSVYVQRWRYSAPTNAASSPALLDEVDGSLIAFAGDGLAGGRLEGAAISGFHAAGSLIAALG